MENQIATSTTDFFLLTRQIETVELASRGLTSLSCRSIVPRIPPSWAVELAARKSTWSWVVRLSSRCRQHLKRASSCRPRISSSRRPTRRILSSRRWSRTWCYTLLRIPFDVILAIPIFREDITTALRCVTIRATVGSYVSSSRTDTTWSRFRTPIRRHVTSREGDAYLYGWMSTRSMEVAPRKGKAASTSSLFNIFGPFHPIGGKGPIEDAEEEALEDAPRTITTRARKVTSTSLRCYNDDMPLYRGKHRDISDQVCDLSDRFDLSRCETRTGAKFR